MLDFDFKDANGVELKRGDYVVYTTKASYHLHFGIITTGYMSSSVYNNSVLKVKIMGVFLRRKDWPNYELVNIESPKAVLKIRRESVPNLTELDECYDNFLNDPKCLKYTL